MLYAAIHGTPDPAATSRPPTNCIWTKQVKVPLAWIVAFLRGRSGNLTRRLTLDSYLRRGPSVILTTDASPYGLGAVLVIEGSTVAHFSDSICKMDRAVLGLQETAPCKDQQVLEALAVLVSLREFSHHWKMNRVTLCIRTDNIAALTMLTKMRPHSVQMGIVARELALDIVCAAYCPEICEHTPGISNVAADS